MGSEHKPNNGPRLIREAFEGTDRIITPYNALKVLEAGGWTTVQYDKWRASKALLRLMWYNGKLDRLAENNYIWKEETNATGRQ